MLIIYVKISSGFQVKHEKIFEIKVKFYFIYKITGNVKTSTQNSGNKVWKRKKKMKKYAKNCNYN